jgi:GTP-binding protein HflX
VLINRRGQVEYTFIGEAKRIYLPDVGRQRAGLGHFRGLRHVHTVLDGEALVPEDLADLTKLRLDLVAALEVSSAGEPGEVAYAYPMPKSADGRGVRQERARSVQDLVVDFDELMRAIEDELGRDRPAREGDAGRERAVIVGLYPNRAIAASYLVELKELAATAQLAVIESFSQIRREIDGKYVIGRGKLEEVVLRCLDLAVDLLIFDHNLSPAQVRAISSFSGLRVIDRTQLILEIFANHARSRDGKLQVELAQLKYNLPRLTDLDAGLSRLTGGARVRGPGETKLEITRRRARDRITRLTREIERLSRQREVKRSRRQAAGVPVVSIVGYTNAGKSTLLNFLTESDVLVANKLFATLDPTSRRLRFPEEREAIVTDTVGFIRELPPDLIKAFRATLEELETADLLLHVVDVADAAMAEKIEAVNATLAALELDGIPQLMVFNKADLVDRFEAMARARQNGGVAVSATTGDGADDLVRHIAHRLWQSALLPTEDAWAASARTERGGDGGAPTVS